MTARLVIRYHWRMASASTSPVDPDITNRVSGLARQIATKIHEVLGDETRVIWFGSWVKGQAQPHSDIDLAIAAAAPLSTAAVARLDLDLVNFDKASERMQQEIRKPACPYPCECFTSRRVTVGETSTSSRISSRRRLAACFWRSVATNSANSACQW